MNSARQPATPFTEIELKLALPTMDSHALAQRLGRLPMLARRKASLERLQNTYYDTPDDALNSQRTALRIRRVESQNHPVWLQTLKMGGNRDSALSQRGEWESTVPGANLEFDKLQATPWLQMDPDGALIRSLVARFTTDFTRTRWTVRNRDGCIVEVAFDLGQIAVGEHSAAICELELELKAGQPAALFDIARQIASVVAVVPLGASKAQRGFALAQSTLGQPLRARPPVLTPDMSVPQAATATLREAFNHFNGNLYTLLTSDDPEVVHQARVGWRRLKTSLVLFKKTSLVQSAPPLHALKPLLKELGRLRDLEVANLQTLPMLANAYVGGSPKRQAHWQALQGALAQAAADRHQSVRHALHNPATGASLLALTEWLESKHNLETPKGHSAGEQAALRPWALQRLERLRAQLKATLKKSPKPDNLHRARILAKRQRYGVETLGALLPKRRAQQWYRQATRLQSSIGADRDLRQALHMAKRLGAHSKLLQFLQTVSLGRKHPR
jgi:inorganic triphosphatase YgiF